MVEINSSDIFSLEQINKNIKVFAGPGAGKTHFLVENVKNIITKNENIVNGRSRKILCITYTNAAVDEIKRRLDRYTEYADICTIHGFIIENLIKPFQSDLKLIIKKDFGIEIKTNDIISSQIEGLGILHGVDREEMYSFIKKELSLHETEQISYSKKLMGEVEVDCLAFVNSCNGDCYPIRQICGSSKIPNKHKLAIKKYIWSIVHKLTHNEILYFGYRIIDENPLALYYLRVKYPYLFVDEFQDTNPLQTLLIKKICHKFSKVCVVGDIAQSIYSFQGARPSDFSSFKIDDNDSEFYIKNNRRSSSNIVNFCDYIRQKDPIVIQSSVNEEAINNKIHFLMGKSNNVKEKIACVIRDGGAVLTRTWAAAFDYIIDIEEDQALLLKKIYNNYYNTPISIRDEIVDSNNVLWVRAFKFIFNLWDSYKSGSIIDFMIALKLYGGAQYQNIDAKSLLMINDLLNNVFQNCKNATTCKIIETYNMETKKPQYDSLKSILVGDFYDIQIFSDLDREDLKKLVNDLNWTTSYKLFNEVFAENSKYLTVHQAKGLEWRKIVVGVLPGKNDKTTLSKFFASPEILGEDVNNEFARIYYVACSRAIEDLYIHIPEGCERSIIENNLNDFISKTGRIIEYEFIE